MRKKKHEKEFNVVRLSPDELIHADEYETKPDENYDAEDDPVTEMELLQYRMDVMDAINSAWDRLQGMDENGYVSVEMPMSPYEKRERGIKRLKPEDIDWSDTEFCENHEFTLEELMNAPEPTDPKAVMNRFKASIRGLKKSNDRMMRELNDIREAADKNGGKIADINEIAMKVLKEQDEKNAKKGRTFVMSDINGDYEKYTELLKKINFGPDDTLYVLGDAIGPDASEHNPRGGYDVLLDMASRPNVHAVLGDCEALAADALPILARAKKIYAGKAPDNTEITGEDVKKINMWYRRTRQKGHQSPAIKSFFKLSKADRKRVLEYIESMPLYREIEVNGEKYVLVHAGFRNFSPDRPLDDYTRDEVTWLSDTPEEERERLQHREIPSSHYFDDKTVIVGHIPSIIIEDIAEYGKLYPRTGSYYGIADFDKLIAINTSGWTKWSPLSCTCLETMEMFHTEVKLQ